MGVVLAGTAAIGFYGWDSERKTVKELEAQIEELMQKDMRSAVDRSVSAQMEEIANEQREISEEKREEALRQTKVANEMRLRSELERQNALEAERNAVASEKKAVEASAVADSQRVMAEHQRIQAEFLKRKADTLSYIALGRSLGSISTVQKQAGNDDIADLLSYASYLYTSRYNGDIYNPTIIQSLMQSSNSMVSWTEHTSAVTNLSFIPNDHNKIVSASNYGEIILSERNGNRLYPTVLFKNSQYDFRDIIIDQQTSNIYAVSRSGHLVIIQPNSKNVKTIELANIDHPIKIYSLTDNNMLIVGENSMGLLDLKRNIVRNPTPLPFNVIAGAEKDEFPLLFDDKGMMHLMNGLDNFTTVKVPTTGKVSTYSQSKDYQLEAYGMSDGTIWLFDEKGASHKLVSHRSRVSTMKFSGRLLFSSSYDGSINLWIPSNEKIEPMTIVQTNNWITHLNFDSTNNTIWFGDIKGNLTAMSISVSQMVDAIKKKLKRNLTTEEWNYFIGQNVPYEKFIER